MQSKAPLLKLEILNLPKSNKKLFNPGVSSYLEVTLLEVLTEGRLSVVFKNLYTTEPKKYIVNAKKFHIICIPVAMRVPCFRHLVRFYSR